MRSLLGFLLVATSFVLRAHAAAPAAPPAAQPANVVKLQASVTSAQIASMPDAQLIEFPNGLRLSAGEVRSLAPLAERLRAGAGSRTGGVLRQPLTGPVVAVKPGTTVNEVLNAPDNAVLQLPDGRKVSVALFRSVQGQLRSTGSTRPQRAAGPAVRVERGTPLAELLKRPDTDVVESPSGRRITVGELRRFVQYGSARGKR
jgi:hypothetical protein